MKYEDVIDVQYGKDELANKILAIFQREGVDTADKVKEILAPIEELHLRGSVATLELAQKAGIDESMRVLDIGCGIGGPARTLASKFGCHVTGLDISEKFCHVAEIINERAGLSNKIEIHQGNALNMPFNIAEFDIVFTQHVLMNIENKKRLLSQVNHILRSKGRLALYTICAGSISPIYYPVFWANNPEINFLLTADELRQLINNSGFRELSWKDDTNLTLEGIQRARSKPRSKTPQPISFDLIMPNPSTKWKNGVRNLEEERMVVIQGVFERDG